MVENKNTNTVRAQIGKTLYAQQNLLHGKPPERRADGIIHTTPRRIIERGAEVPADMSADVVERLLTEGLLGEKPPAAAAAKSWRPTTGIVGEDPVQEKKVAEI